MTNTEQSGTRVVGDWLRREAAADPDRDFLQCGAGWMTLGELDSASERLAAGLQSLGLEKGDRLAVMLPNCTEYAVAVFACAKAGVVQVPINTYLRGDFLRHQLAQSGTSAFLADGLGLQQIEPLRAELPDLQHLILLDGAIEGTSVPDGTHDYATLAASSAELAPVELSAADLCVIMYTSGTTGPSKGCMISHGYYTFIPRAFMQAGWFGRGDRLFGASPMFHFSGQTMLIGNALAAGGSVVVEPAFSATTFMARAKETESTCLFGMGAMAAAVLAQPVVDGEAEHSIRQSSWIPMPPAMQEQWTRRFGIPVASEVFGQSECWPATLGIMGGERKAASVGRVIPGVEIVLVDDDDNPVPVGGVGEICIRTAAPHMMFQGYWNDPEATIRTFRHLWHHTGDNGRFDEDGFLYFADRRKDSLRRRGENVSSIELEQALMKHPAIAQAAVHAVPSELTEDDIKACLVLADGADPSIDGLFDHFKASVPYYAIPRYLEFLPALPANVNGRVQKYLLRERGITAETIDLEAKGLVVDKAERRS